MGSKTILVCPLDWGLGHASRCVPIIKKYIEQGHKVIIGADKNPLTFLKQEFPELKTITIPGYEIEYDKKGSSLKLFYESVKFYSFIKKEKQFLDKILDRNNVDLIISDNRYGLYNDEVESIIITHQLYPKAPAGEVIAHKKIAQLLNNFNEVWVPDYEEGNNLSGDLSHLKPFEKQHKFIGPLSRFTKPTESPKIEFDVCAIISGPEPQRTIFEEIVMEQIKTNNLKAVIVRGLPNDNSKNKNFFFNHLPTEKLQEYILKSKTIVCRSGYSSIMDLDALKKDAILIPTPGQTEQEYLATYHKNNKQFLVQQQNKLDLKL